MRNTHTRRLGAVALAAAGALIISGCAAGTRTDSATKPLVIDTTFSLKTADPSHNYEPTGQMVTRALYSSLVTYAGGDVSQPVGDLAESWTVSPDGLTYTFALNQKAVFSDGTDVTADDVVFTLNRVANLKANPSFLVEGMTVAAVDDDTVTITTETLDPAVLAKLASPSLGILNSAAAKKVGATDAADADTTDTAEASLNEESLGSGPYTLKKFDVTSEVVLVANENYWGDAPKFPTVVISNVDASQQKTNVTSGQADIALDLSPDQVADIGEKATVEAGPSPYTIYLINKANPELSKWTANADFQDAVRFGIDYDGLLELAGEGSVRAPGMIAQQIAGALPASDAVPYDVDKAKESLEASGYDGTPIELSYPSDFTLNGVSFTDMATRLQGDFEKIGITIELKGAPIANLLDPESGPKQQLALWFWGADYPEGSNFLSFGPGGPSQRIQWAAGSAPAIEEIMAAVVVETDVDRRTALYQDFQRELNKGPVMSLIQPAQVFLLSKRVTQAPSNLVWILNPADIS
ncbi:ABC transporter substrate-binding protein [Microbacterium saperdae]